MSERKKNIFFLFTPEKFVMQGGHAQFPKYECMNTKFSNSLFGEKPLTKTKDLKYKFHITVLRESRICV